ncbi:inorganic diphosphatase [Streptosporangium sp. NPDC002721]|uniref:inorganic diphosphatase n=1 Tax=Streptosporangium sp. NPDC002721 TaxID=3366188 RepID=UPI00368B9A29
MPDEWSSLSLWEHADRMIKEGAIVIDRPARSAHPKFPDYRYPLNYGYIADTVGGDGEGVDVWVGSGEIEQVTAIACTIDPIKLNAELKMLWRCTDEEVARIEWFYLPQPQSALVIRRHEPR